jgi:hypothetical protein
MKLPVTFLVALAACLSNVLCEDNTFKNSTVGFSVTKPADWRFATLDQHMENLSRTKLNDEQMQEAMQKYATVPLVVMMKHPEPYDDLNPSFKANIKPLGNLPADDPVAIINLMTAPMARMFKDFKVVEPAAATTVAGLKAAHVRIHYSLAIPDGREFPTVSDLWIVLRGKYYIILGAGMRQDGKTGTREEIEKILSSVVIDK